jgi:tRNA nucleotidyltransferase (CCA-adding enzyme)
MKTSILQANCLAKELATHEARFSPSELVSRLNGCREEALVITWVAFYDQPNVQEMLDRYLREWRFVVPTVDGDTLRALNLPPGPTYRQILWKLRSAWLDGVVKTVDEEHALLQKLIAETKKRD